MGGLSRPRPALSGPRLWCIGRAASSRVVLALAQPLKTRPTRSTQRVANGSAHSIPANVSPLVHSILSSPALEAPEGSDMLQLLKVTEAYWKTLRNSKHEPDKPGPIVVKRVPGKLSQGPAEYDVCICGGTLGVILGLALQMRGHRVCILEKRKLEGRNQEWNISRGELHRLVAQGLLTASELEACIVSEFNPVRVGFRGMPEDIYVRDVLNVGVQPRLLLDTLKHKFLAAGGALFEHTAFKSADVFDDGVVIKTLSARHAELPLTPGDANRPLACSPAAATGAGRAGPGAGADRVATGAAEVVARPPSISCRMVLDCMGHWGPIIKQIRGGAKPSGMVVVVGGCFEGIPQEKNTAADLLYSFRESEDDMQLFWEAFPAAGGLRTAYMFTYLDADPQRPTFATLLHKYFTQLPEYQGVPMRQLQFKRVLFGAFPCWPGSSPLPPAFDRVLQVGDAAAGQSPLSFGGFGSMVRQLPRLAEGIDQALQGDLLSRADLSWLQPYQPSLSVAWLFQRAMSVGVGQLKQGAGAMQTGEQPPLLQGAEVDLPPWQLAVGAVRNAIVPAPGLVHDGPLQEQSQAAQPVAAQQVAAERAEQQAPAAAAGLHSSSAAWAAQQQQQQQQQQLDSGWGATCGAPAAAAATAADSSSAVAAAARAQAAGGGWLDPGHVNRLLRCNFAVMRWFGEGVMRPFLQDTLRFVPLAATMVGMSFRDPLAVVTVVRQLGARVLLDWTRHYLLLGLYTLLHALLSPLRHLLAPKVGKAGQRGWRETAAAATATPAAAGAGAESSGPSVVGEKGAGQLSGAGKGPAANPLSQVALKARYVALRALDALAAGAGME